MVAARGGIEIRRTAVNPLALSLSKCRSFFLTRQTKKDSTSTSSVPTGGASSVRTDENSERRSILAKMIGFGAQISDKDYDVMLDYLARHQGVEAK
jgi:hypothetical protein